MVPICLFERALRISLCTNMHVPTLHLSVVLTQLFLVISLHLSQQSIYHLTLGSIPHHLHSGQPSAPSIFRTTTSHLGTFELNYDHPTCCIRSVQVRAARRPLWIAAVHCSTLHVQEEPIVALHPLMCLDPNTHMCDSPGTTHG